MPTYNGLDMAIRNKTLNWLFRNADNVFGSSATWQVRLMSANGTPSAAGTEISATYFTGGSAGQRASVSFLAAASGEVRNSAAVNFYFSGVVDTDPSTSINGLTIVGIEVWQAETATRLLLQPLDAPRTVRGGQTLSFPANTIRFVLS